MPETVFTGTVHAEKAISSDEDVKAQAVSLVNHLHGNVMNGQGQTTQPISTGGGKS